MAQSISSLPRHSLATLVRVAAFTVALVLVMVLTVVLVVAWLEGDAPDLYARVDAESDHRSPTVAIA